MNDYDISGMTDEEKAMPKYTYGHRIPYEWVDDVITTLHQYQKAFEDIRAELTDCHRASERRYWTYDDLMELLEKHDPSKAGKE